MTRGLRHPFSLGPGETSRPKGSSEPLSTGTLFTGDTSLSDSHPNRLLVPTSPTADRDSRGVRPLARDPGTTIVPVGRQTRFPVRWGGGGPAG